MFFLLGAVATLVVGFAVFGAITEGKENKKDCKECEDMKPIPSEPISTKSYLNYNAPVASQKEREKEYDRRVGR